MISQKSLLEQAKSYVAEGFSVIPIKPRSKVSAIAWKPYQRRSPHREELESWFRNEELNIAVVCGSVSRVIVVDVDERNGGLESAKSLHLPPTRVVKTPGGFHYYYRLPKGLVVKKSNPKPGIDIQAEGSYVVAPPSSRKEGTYSLMVGLEEMVDAPAWLVASGAVKTKGLWKLALEGDNKVTEGNRNAVAASVCGKLMKNYGTEHADQVWREMQVINLEKFEPPLSEKELKSVLNSIIKISEDDPKALADDKEIERDRLTKYVLSKEPKLYVTKQGDAYAHLGGEYGNALHKVGGERFRQWLQYSYWDETKRGCGTEAIRQAASMITSLAVEEGELVDVYNRVGKSGDVYYYDIGNRDNGVIRVTEEGWKMVPGSDIQFARYTHQLEQVNPVNGGDLDLLFKYLNVSDPSLLILLKAYLVSLLVPDIAHPIPLIYGPHGSAKSTFLRVIRRLIDPSCLELLTFPSRTEELVQMLNHHWLAYFDNVSRLSMDMSDELCKACTGGGMSKRKLYTDGEDVIFFFKRCIALNGINNVASRADLLSRSLMVELQPFQDHERKVESEFWKEFETDLPRILGGLLDLFANSLRELKNVRSHPRTRLADFERWGFAVARALGLNEGDFSDAYRANRAKQNEEALEAHEVGSTVMKWFEDSERKEFDGTMEVLLSTLKDKAFGSGIDTDSKYWPKTASQLGRRLREVENNLRTAGICIDYARTSKERRIKISLRKPVSDSHDGDDVETETIPF